MNRKTIISSIVGVFILSFIAIQPVVAQLNFSSLKSLVGGSKIDNASGLKDALSVGITNAVSSLNRENGYFGNEAVKILLPKEAAPIVDNIKMVPGGENMLSDVILRLNRAAEDAAGDAMPIFIDALKRMTFTDATGILFGSDPFGATNYMRKNTHDQLVIAFQPKIEASLDKKLVGNVSTNESWKILAAAYNSVAHSFVGKMANLHPVNANLGAYTTEQALVGLYYMMGNEEKKIRESPEARVNPTLQKVFGQLDTRR